MSHTIWGLLLPTGSRKCQGGQQEDNEGSLSDLFQALPFTVRETVHGKFLIWSESVWPSLRIRSTWAWTQNSEPKIHKLYQVLLRCLIFFASYCSTWSPWQYSIAIALRDWHKYNPYCATLSGFKVWFYSEKEKHFVTAPTYILP